MIKNPPSFLLRFVLLCFLSHICTAGDNITQGQSLRDGESLISADENFALGFFSPENSTLRYLGIWYHTIGVKTYVWVANREKPISDKSGSLVISKDGNLKVLDGRNNVVWSSNATVKSNNGNNRIAILKRTGNFILSNNDTGEDLSKTHWQSFDHPTDTYLPGMRVRVNPRTGDNHCFRSWNSINDPSPGNYTLGIDPNEAPQIVIWEREKRIWRSGQWNSAIFTGVPNMTRLSNFLYGFKLSSPPESDGSTYFTYVPSQGSDFLRFRVRFDGKEEQFKWDFEKRDWNLLQRQPANECEEYNHCGTFGVCNALEVTKCSCLDGYEIRDLDQWNRGNWSGGCKRRTELKCERNASLGGVGEDDGFAVLKGMKLPDFESVLSLDGVETCADRCLKNCSCTAFAEVNGIGCMIWDAELVDIQRFDIGGSVLHVRVADSELEHTSKPSKTLIIVVVVVGTFLLATIVLLLWIFNKKLRAWYAVLRGHDNTKDLPMFDANRKREFSTEFSGSTEYADGSQMNPPELPIFNFDIIALSTDNFSEANTLGHGGFGSVYKGKLPGGEEIAVKRLSGKSVQGLEEFKTEIILIAKLQHRNLVRLLGCCIQGEEKMLLYEYMPNKSLDFFLFDDTKQATLDWTTRFAIIEGIARGLLYLHRDSRLRIIHRDLKASNILLDVDMNPKISDFGMARIFGGNQNEANTVRVVGTYGYMSPEYAMEGLFSIKSDVYSFGVLLLEIITGRRNTSFRGTEHCSLLGYAWHLWNQGKQIELVDPSIQESIAETEVLRCIQVGMLCVQDSAFQRPDMASVMLMLESETATLPLPKQPTFTSMRSSLETTDQFGLDGQDLISSSDLTVSMVNGR